MPLSLFCHVRVLGRYAHVTSLVVHQRYDFALSSWRICLYIVVILTFIAVRPFVMFFMDIFLEYKGYSSVCFDCGKVNKTANIPWEIHQVFFYISDKVIPTHLTQAQLSWKRQNPDFKYTLWNASMVESLIQQKYPTLLEVYHSYGHWVQRADFARYIILHHSGGVYADIDIECVNSLSRLYKTFQGNTEFVMYRTSPFGVSNDFIISKPNHPYITSVVAALPAANRWYIIPYLTVFFSTGPLYLYSRYQAWRKKEDILILESTKWFLKHKTGAAWHELDGKLIWLLYIKREIVYKCVLITLVILVAIIVLFLCWKRRTSICSKMSSLPVISKTCMIFRTKSYKRQIINV